MQQYACNCKMNCLTSKMKLNYFREIHDFSELFPKLFFRLIIFFNLQTFAIYIYIIMYVAFMNEQEKNLLFQIFVLFKFVF